MAMEHDTPAPHALGRLIDLAKEVSGRGGRPLSDVDLVHRAEMFGHTMSKSNISRYRNKPVQEMRTSQVAALAAALQLPKERVVDAFLQSMGYLTRTSARPSVEDAIAGDESLPPEVREMLLDLYRLWRKRARTRRSSQGADESGETSEGSVKNVTDPPDVRTSSDPALVREKSQAVYIHNHATRRGEVNGDAESEAAQEV